MNANVKFFDTDIKTAVISIVSINLIQKQYQAMQSDFPQHHIQFYSDQPKSMQEMKPRGFALCQPCDTPSSPTPSKV